MNLFKKTLFLMQVCCFFVTSSFAILHVCLKDRATGSVEVALAHYRQVLDLYENTHIVVSKGSYAESQLQKKKLPYIATDVLKYRKHRALYVQKLQELIQSLCLQYHIKIIAGHKALEYNAVRTVAEQLHSSSVAFYHVNSKPNPYQFKNFSAFVAMSPSIGTWMEKRNKKLHLNIKNISFIPPIFNEERIKSFQPLEIDGATFFKKYFGIAIGQHPIMLIVANLIPCKNHKQAIQVLYELKNEGIIIDLVLAGNNRNNALKTLRMQAQSLGVEDQLHYLGYTSLVPELLYYSDFMVLPSTHEAFGIVLLEAGLMKKPVISTIQNGSSGFLIKHGQTGLLFDAYNVKDFGTQIKTILSHRVFAQRLGENLYNSVISDFASTESWYVLKKIYKDLGIKL